jgi:DNA repair protein RadA/Sms
MRFDRCPRCGVWDTCQRVKITRERALRLSDVTSDDDERFPIRPDWDKALGGGGKAGMVVLIAGKPGAGKTTEMLTLAATLGTTKHPALYLSSERDVKDLASSARKIRIDASVIAPVRVRTMREVRRAIDRIMPSAIFLDSATNLDSFESDDLVDIRESAGDGITFVICHVTKAQEIAGRNGIAHDASAIVWIRGKTLRTTKNWYGPAPLSVKRSMPKWH